MEVYHYAPLHYLLFIARTRALLSKEQLKAIGHTLSHFRRTSRDSDIQRGFGDYVHLCLDPHPRILQAKLEAGFPHFELRVAAKNIEVRPFHLCRYNIAKSRNPRYGKNPAPEGPGTGRYHGDKQIPTAETCQECQDLLTANLRRRMIEVLIPQRLPLPPETEIVFFCADDHVLAEQVLTSVGITWRLTLDKACKYNPRDVHARAVREFLRRSQNDESWLGSGLNFDLFRSL